MSAPLFYRPGSKWQTAAAFVSAVLIHGGAVALAELKPDPPPAPTIGADDEKWIIIEPDQADAQATPPPPVEELEVAPPPPPISDRDFKDDDKPTPPPRRTAKAAPPLVRPPSNA
ncbi:MAG TPA: hypothetical protein VK993_02120, partial [Chthoniobacterales bacterium]|nr:hypothetical protein [Chthoniobacterales bacterium]